ncbi:flavodoxin [Petrotoga sp. 9PWA.NaAc.5.4]|uniref:flavodoxin n=1 Tax=Petrotoga sp. 9PWA.NaAc.5.4 TaxID=1434328 RepID=UPI0018ED26C3|nr:flavodoxin [Petrotoga sp. 9PWA.NaAc.5.4]
MEEENKKILIAYFSWDGNTKTIAEKIQSQKGGDLFEVRTAKPYSSNYQTVLREAKREQQEGMKPELITHVENMDEYDIIILGYPNWWGTIPMPIVSFLEEYDFSGKTILPFCSHGGGELGRSVSDITKLVPNAKVGRGLPIYYSGGSDLDSKIKKWLEENSK